MKLFIGNRNYSSWSLRVWLIMRHFDLSFEERLLRLDGAGWKQNMLAATPTGKVPTLEDGGLMMDESIAIIEYLADRFVEKPIWPQDIKVRAEARMLASRMHAGYGALRNAAPMNVRARLPGCIGKDVVRNDLDAMSRSLVPFLEREGGPFLFGSFGGVDAMYAPVAVRVRTYGLKVSDPLAIYFEAILDLPAFLQWEADALAEPWIVPQDEIGDGVPEA